ncbi:MAG: FemAB family XrtA/PEP-CTERM system-associated protein [Pseudomonadota bacterium]|nr:FemAB family XrtA/PEP-CTERM system-associated protein [Pseudomonadota bacterium]
MNAPIAMTQQVTAIDLYDPRQCERVEAFLAEQGASLFHRPAWLKAVEAGTRQKAVGLICEQLGAITGWLPLSQVRSMLFGKALVSSGFGVGGGVCCASEEAGNALVQEAQAIAVAGGFASIELRGGALPTGDGWQHSEDKHSGFIADLAEDDDAQLKWIPRKARAEVRKGLKNDFPVRIGRSDDDLRAHYAVYSESVRNLGTPVFPAKLFSAMLDAFPDSSDILTVFKDGQPISSVLNFYHGGAVMPFWGGGTYAARDARSNDVMYYELMLHARRKGMQRFDFGRSKNESGPWKYKKNWGFEPEPLTYAEWTAPGQEARDVDPTSEAYSRKIELWKKLPLPVANAIGPLIARGLA